VHWSHSHADRFPDGCLYVDLRGYDSGPPVDPAQAVTGFLRALGCGSIDGSLDLAERAAQYRSMVAGRRMLIVLDNARDTEQVRQLLPGSATSFVLVTSRDNLSGLVARHGARRIDLDLLPMPEAVALLRALIDRRLSIDADTLATVAAQCARLPLALRIAAEFLDARPTAQLRDLAAELSGALHPLDLFDVGGDPSSSVRAVFSWSYRQLSSHAARAFLLIGQHPEPLFEPHALARLDDLSPTDAQQAVDALLRAHLVQQAGAGRYRMHPLLHDYAAELAAAEQAAAGVNASPPELSVLPTGEARVARRPDRTPSGSGIRPSAPVWRI
jgi:hypothetical protein